MEALIIDLRYKMKEVLRALDRKETVKIFYQGKLKGIIHPVAADRKVPNKKELKSHPFFGMIKDRKESVDDLMNQLRGERYCAF